MRSNSTLSKQAVLNGVVALLAFVLGTGGVELVLQVADVPPRDFSPWVRLTDTGFGYALARGHAPDELMGEGHKLSEGAFTAEAACRLGRSIGVELPIAEAVRAVVAGEQGVDAAIDALLARPLPFSE